MSKVEARCNSFAYVKFTIDLDSKELTTKDCQFLTPDGNCQKMREMLASGSTQSILSTNCAGATIPVPRPS